jgi:hypothetical protein
LKTRNVLKWLENSWGQIVDPDRDKRIQDISKYVHRLLAEKRQDFDFREAIASYSIDESDIPGVQERVYSTCVERAWKDLELTDKEARSLEWVASKLSIPHSERKRINSEFGHQHIQMLVATFLGDGFIDDSEQQKINQLAKWVEIDAKTLARSAVKSAGAGLIRSLFISATQDGELSEDEWTQLCVQVERLGLSKAEFNEAIEHQASTLIENTLANARLDEDLRPEEDEQLQWLIDRLVHKASHKRYFLDELEHFRQITLISKGCLPLLQCPTGITLKSGEILHADCPVTMSYTRQLKTGPTQKTIQGRALISDSRLLIIGEPKSIEVPYRSVVACFVNDKFVEIRCSNSGSGSGTYQFLDSPILTGSILECAIKRSKQTMVDKTVEPRTRSIPRDVRQRVWQKYGGRCAECDSDQYLEFDHIVPFSRGGGNSDQNVQLLCRRCNLKKRDAI